MKGVKEAFIDAGEISQMLGIGMTKAYAIIKEYNAELEAKGYFTMRGKCPRKYFEQKIYGYEDYYNPDYEPQRNRSKVAEEMDYEAAVGDSVISEQDEVDKPPETNELSEDGAEIAENVMLDADVMVKEAVKLGNSQGRLYYSDIDKLQSSLDDVKKTFGEVLEVWRLQRS